MTKFIKTTNKLDNKPLLLNLEKVALFESSGLDTIVHFSGSKKYLMIPISLETISEIISVK